MAETYSGTSGSGSRAGIWTVAVTVGGVDLSSRLVRALRIGIDEGSARVAELSVRPVAGTEFAVSDWVGKTVTIDIADMATGTPASVVRLFTGVVDTPDLDLVTRVIGLRCTDDLQQTLEAMTPAAVASATPGATYSAVVFDPAARGWMLAQDRLATLRAALDKSPAGALRLTPWLPAASPHFSFTESHLIDGSLSVSMASRQQLVNEVTIDFGYRFPRVKAELWEVSETYVDEGSLAAFVAAGNWFLTRAAVEAAIEGAGGTIQSITYTPLPASGTYGTWVPGPYDYLLCMGFTATVSFDYAQQIEEQHTITVSAPASLAAVGTLKDRLSGALEGVYPPIATAEQSALLYRNKISGIPPLDTAPLELNKTRSDDVTLTTDTDRAAANLAMRTLIEVAKTRIWASHRRNRVAAAIALNPALDVDKTVDLAVSGLHIKGKCGSVTHVLNPETGEAVTEFAVAVCSVVASGTVHPGTATTDPAASSPATSTLTGSVIVTWNYGPTDDHLITVEFPGVAEAERNAAIVPLTASFDADMTEDTLEITL